MQIVFIHQGFPGQYSHIINYLANNSDYSIVGLGLASRPASLPASVKYYQYRLTRGTSKNIYPLSQEFEAKTIRAFACASKLSELKDQGLSPNIICAHPGWGESLLIKSVFPDVPILSYQEYFYNLEGFDYDFDPEHLIGSDLFAHSKLLLKNTHLYTLLHQSVSNVTPTYFQKSTFPTCYQDNINVIHDGVIVPQDLTPFKSIQINNILLDSTCKIITFVNRTLEPYRGCHTFIRAIPSIFEKHPDAYIVIIGSAKGVSYGERQPDSDSWGSHYFAEIKGTFPVDRVVLTGSIPYSTFSNLLRLSSCHVYLTYPFVLSWSLLDAMAHSLPIVASSTSPVQEFITHKQTGLLVDFFDSNKLAQNVSDILDDPISYRPIAECARQLIANSFSIEHCVPRHIELIERFALSS